MLLLSLRNIVWLGFIVMFYDADDAVGWHLPQIQRHYTSRCIEMAPDPQTQPASAKQQCIMGQWSPWSEDWLTAPVAMSPSRSLGNYTSTVHSFCGPATDKDGKCFCWTCYFQDVDCERDQVKACSQAEARQRLALWLKW